MPHAALPLVETNVVTPSPWATTLPAPEVLVDGTTTTLVFNPDDVTPYNWPSVAWIEFPSVGKPCIVRFLGSTPREDNASHRSAARDAGSVQVAVPR